MTAGDDEFTFGIEAELLVVDAATYAPLWHRDLTFSALNEVLEAIDIADVPLEGLAPEPPHDKLMPFVVEGYHLPDAQMSPVDILPKGIEIRTPVSRSIDEAVGWLRELYRRLDVALAARGLRTVALSFHPFEHHFEGPQNKRRYDYWQWAMQAMLTYGPDVNVGLPAQMFAALDLDDVHARVNYYVPALTALTLASPIYRGGLWRTRGRIGKSIRTYARSVVAPALEVHPDERGRLELKSFEMPVDFDDFRALLLVWLELLLDEDLPGRASSQTRVYDLGAVARDGLVVDVAVPRAAAVLDRAPAVLGRWGFDASPLDVLRARLETRRLPADAIVATFEAEGNVPGLLRHLSPR